MPSRGGGNCFTSPIFLYENNHQSSQTLRSIRQPFFNCCSSMNLLLLKSCEHKFWCGSVSPLREVCCICDSILDTLNKVITFDIIWHLQQWYFLERASECFLVASPVHCVIFPTKHEPCRIGVCILQRPPHRPYIHR